MSTRLAMGLVDRRRFLLRARYRRRRTGLLVALAAAAVAAGTWWVLTGPLFAVHEVQISGYTRGDQAKLVRAVQIAAERGTATAVPDAEVRSVLALFPWVAGVELHHNWPRGLDVRIRQATPAAVVATGSGDLLVSAEGRVLGPNEGRSRELPVLEIADARPGQWLSRPGRGLLEFSSALSPDLAARLTELRIEGGVVRGRLVDGPQLRIGPLERMWAKGVALEAVIANLAEEQQRATGYIDLSAPRQPVLGGLTPEAGASGDDQQSTQTQASP